ncbi:MAG TPA: hypothetical protein VEH29_08655 [Acidimicrobiales bacterium]|nr:hypothetical protein [Acidimicrobiales bacterium]
MTTKVAPAAVLARFRSGAGERCRLEERGSESVEIVVVLPVLMALLVIGLQLAMWGLAAHALSLGVAEGGAAARAQFGGPAQATALVEGDVRSIAGTLVGSLKVAVHGLPDDFVVVSATGVVPMIFPGLELHVSAVSAGPVQGFRASG